MPQFIMKQNNVYKFVQDQLIQMSGQTEDETCQVHEGEPLIAHEQDDTSVFGCNKCVFERKMKEPVFLTYSAKDTK